MRNAVFTLFALSALTVAANAGTVTATLNYVNPGAGVTATLGGSPTATTAGQFNWTATTNGSTFGLAVDGGGNFTAFCIELTQNVGFGGSYTYTEDFLSNAPDPAGPFSPVGVIKAAQIARLFTVYNNDFVNDPNLKAAALQTAIWETVYETTVGLPSAVSGNFFVDNSAVGFVFVHSLADSYLAAQYFAPETGGLFALTSPTNQDMVVTPAPGAAALLGLGGLVALRRRPQRLLAVRRRRSN